VAPIRIAPDRPTVSVSDTATPGGRCPACGEPLFPWLEAPDSDPAQRRRHVLDRCENCRLGLEREDGGEALADLIEGVAERGGGTVEVPNGASIQAGIGAENWSAMQMPEHPYLLTPRALELLLEHERLEIARLSYPARPAMAAMMQTLLNLITFNRNFAGSALRGSLRPGQARPGRIGFVVDAAITTLAAIPVAIIAVLLEGGAGLARRGGVLRATVRRRAL
jgi:hypothetical protein